MDFLLLLRCVDGELNKYFESKEINDSLILVFNKVDIERTITLPSSIASPADNL